MIEVTFAGTCLQVYYRFYHPEVPVTQDLIIKKVLSQRIWAR